MPKHPKKAKHTPAAKPKKRAAASTAKAPRKSKKAEKAKAAKAEAAKAGFRIQGHPVVAKPVNISELIERIEENLPAA